MSKEGADDVIYCTDFSFDFSILRGGVRTRKSEGHSILFTRFLKQIVIIFFAIVTLKTFYWTLKLCLNVSTKL